MVCKLCVCVCVCVRLTSSETTFFVYLLYSLVCVHCREVLAVTLEEEVVGGEVGVVVGVVEEAGVAVGEETSMEHSKQLKKFVQNKLYLKLLWFLFLFQPWWSRWRVYGTKPVQPVCHAPSSASKANSE